MEKKNNKGLVITIVILSLLVVGLGGYIIYEKVNYESAEKNNNCTNDNTVENDKMNESENINTADHVELEDSVKTKLKEVFEFVYDYYNTAGSYCGTISFDDEIEPQPDNVYNASTQYSSFNEMINHLKKYMTEHVIYGLNYMSADSYIEKDGKLYCPNFNKGGFEYELDSTIKYSKPYDQVIYTKIEAKATYDNYSETELYNVTFEQKNNNWVISSYEKISNY